tara:strand:+ start:3303 stop:5054 length:1752 start_codon:yes stop_codon:yes gene_type:complete
MRFLSVLLLFLSFLITTNAFGGSIEDQFSDVENLLDINQTKDALELLKKIEPETEIETAKQSYLLGRLYFSLQKFKKADEFYSNASLQDPSEPLYKVALSQTSYALGKLKLAERYAKIALRINPDLLDAELTLALVLSKYGEKKEAEKRFITFTELQPSNETLFLTYAKFLEQINERKKAIFTLEKFILKNSNTPDAHDYLGRLYWFNGKLDLAIKNRETAAMLYRKSGNMLMSSSISKWINSKKEIIIAERKKEEEEEAKKVIPQKPKPRYSPSPLNEIEPFPIYQGQEAYAGSGFIINNGKQIITNKHVIEGAKKIFIRNGLGELRIAEVDKISAYDDLALLTLDKPYDKSFSLSIPDNYKLRTGQSALVMGFPLASELGESSPSLTQGIVSKVTGLGDNIGTFLITSKLNKGNSGGPIFSDTGELIGVAVAKLNSTLLLEETGYIPEDVNVAIHIDRVKRFINSSTKIENQNELKPADLYEIKLPSVVMVVSVVKTDIETEEVNAIDIIEEEIKNCQSNYDTENYNNITRKQFNDFCVCYVNSLADLIQENPKYISYSTPSDEFLNETDKIIKACYEKVI